MPGDGTSGDTGAFDGGSRAGRRRATHFERVRRPRMAEVTDRPATPWRAVAEAEVGMAQGTLSAVIDGTTSKGDVLSVAEQAGVVGAKRAAELIPLAHSAMLTNLVVSASPDRASGSVRIRAETAAFGPTGVEMEALTAAAVAALTVYDMIRESEPGAVIRSVRLMSTSGGETDEWHRPSEAGDFRRPPKGARVAGRIAPSGPRAGASFRPPAHRRSP